LNNRKSTSDPLRKLWAVGLLVGLLLTQACSSGGSTGPDEPNKPDPVQLPDNPAVAADGVMETATWNLEWYGDGVAGNGPSDEALQTRNILITLDSLRADLYAFEEVYSTDSLQNIVSHMSGYRGFAADDYMQYNQRTAFVYNTAVIDSMEVGAITEMQDSYDWAGRYPFYFKFDYKVNGQSMPFVAVVIHAKAFDDRSAYERRKAAADSLHKYLARAYPDANLLLMGDFNDDMDESIYTQAPDSPYQVFVADSTDYDILTLPLSEQGMNSTVNYSDMIDHIIISDELKPYYKPGSIEVFKNVENFITDYGTTTSDHYPVWAKFNLSGN